jgi:tripartite-type tricarboxylate transporter receptor subunit TctC
MMPIFLKIVLIFGILISPTYAWEPSKPITVVVAGPPGSLHDSAIRTLIPYFEKNTKIKFIFDHKPGAGGNLATRHFLNQEKDDHLLFIASSISHMMGGITHPNIATWNPIDDFEYTIVTLAATGVIASAANGDIKSLDDLIRKARNSAKPILVGVTFPNQEAFMIKLAEHSKIPREKFKFIRYDNPNQTIIDVINGNLDIWIGGITPTVPFVESGKLHYIAHTSDEDLDYLPGITSVNSMYPGTTMTSYLGILLPRGTSTEVINWYVKNLKLAAESVEAQEIRKKLKTHLPKNLLTPNSMKNQFKKSRLDLEPSYKEAELSK